MACFSQRSSEKTKQIDQNKTKNKRPYIRNTPTFPHIAIARWFYQPIFFFKSALNCVKFLSRSNGQTNFFLCMTSHVLKMLDGFFFSLFFCHRLHYFPFTGRVQKSKTKKSGKPSSFQYFFSFISFYSVLAHVFSIRNKRKMEREKNSDKLHAEIHRIASIHRQRERKNPSRREREIEKKRKSWNNTWQNVNYSSVQILEIEAYSSYSARFGVKV